MIPRTYGPKRRKTLVRAHRLRRRFRPQAGSKRRTVQRVEIGEPRGLTKRLWQRLAAEFIGS